MIIDLKCTREELCYFLKDYFGAKKLKLTIRKGRRVNSVALFFEKMAKAQVVRK